MLTREKLLSLEKDDLQEMSKTMLADDLSQLADWLSEKDDTVRYHAFLLLQHRSRLSGDVYPYWNVFYEKLRSSNSYQRSIGLMLIAANARWDIDNKLDSIIDDYLLLLHDEKPITVRQCIQSLCEIVPYKEHLHMKIAEKLMSINIGEIKETMQKLVLTDILTVLAKIRMYWTDSKIEEYIFKAISGGVLDKKAVKQVEALLQI